MALPGTSVRPSKSKATADKCKGEADVREGGIDKDIARYNLHPAVGAAALLFLKHDRRGSWHVLM